jgi:hypothetical protein
MYLRITFIGSTNFLCFPIVTGRRLQPSIFSSCNLREDPTPQFYGSKQKEATTTYVLWLQSKGGYNHLPLPHLVILEYKCQIDDKNIVTLSL